MLEKLKGLSQKYAEIEYMLSQSEVWADAQKAAALSREKAELAPLMEAYARYETFRQEAESAEELLSRIIAPFILKGAERCGFRAGRESSLQEPAQLPADGTQFSAAPSPDRW